MEGVLDCIGFFVKDAVNLERPPKIVGFGPSSIEGWWLFPSQIGFVVNGGSYRGLGRYWCRHGGGLYLGLRGS